MAIHAFTNASSVHRVLGGQPSIGQPSRRQVVAPGATIDFDTKYLIAQDLTEIAAGYFTVVPPLPAGISESVGGNAQDAKIIAWVLDHDAEILFPAAGPLAGTAGGAAVSVILNVVDANGKIDIFNDTFEVTVASDLSGVIAEAMPIKFTDGVATINVTDAIVETITLSLSGGPAGITVTDTVQIVFS